MATALLFEIILFRVLSLAALVLGLWAFIDAVRHPAPNYQRENKRTKGFWLGMTGVSAVVCAFSVLGSGGAGFLQLIAACISCVYLADVRPAVGGKGSQGYFNY